MPCMNYKFRLIGKFNRILYLFKLNIRFFLRFCLGILSSIYLHTISPYLFCCPNLLQIRVNKYTYRNISFLKCFNGTIKTFKKADIPVSIFIDPDLKQIRTAKKIGADCVEINTGKYSEAKTEKESDVEFEKVKDAVKFAYKSKFIVHAGHGLTYKNVKRISDLKEISELNIGHNIIARAVLVGMERAVREMLNIMNQ